MIEFRISFFLLLILSGCSSSPSKSSSRPIDHHPWTLLLKKHVSAKGFVDYQSFVKDSSLLNSYLRTLSDNAPNDVNWNVSERMAYWINAYNAFTVKLIVDHYPVSSIRDIGSQIQIPFVLSPWDIKFITINEKQMDLNNIEHGVLRKEFNDPRIHFAIVCASKSCPRLRNEAYQAEILEKQLEEQAHDFFSDSTKNVIRPEKVKVSKIFSWFKSDFTKDEELIEFIDRYTELSLNSDTEISHLQYDWSLNGK